MKRASHLIDKIGVFDNLMYAYWKARKGKTEKPEVKAYRSNLIKNIFVLQHQILKNEIKIGNYRYFKIYEPKERQICAAPFADRVLHHALMNVCHSYFEGCQIFDSYATRPGKGTFAALNRAATFAGKYKWYAKLDVRKYFDSISHPILINQLNNLFKDKQLISIFTQIIKSYETNVHFGLPIGNLTSQYFANHYLMRADRFVSETLQIPAYLRYMDDMVLFENDKNKLLQSVWKFEAFIVANLQLKLKPIALNTCEHGLPFLGFRVFKYNIQLLANSKKRFEKKLKKYASNFNLNIWNEAEYQQHLIPLFSFVSKANSKAWRKKVIQF